LGKRLQATSCFDEPTRNSNGAQFNGEEWDEVIVMSKHICPSTKADPG